MKPVAYIYAGIALVASVVAGTFWLELRKANEVNAALQGRSGETLHAANPPSGPSPDTTLPATVETAAPVEAPTSSTGSSAPMPGTNAVLGRLQDIVERQKELLKDPEYQKMQSAQMRVTIERSYPGLAQELGLSEKEADRLFDLLTESQLSRMADGYIFGGQIDQQEARRKQQEFDRVQEESIQAQLGAKYTQWQAYQQTRPVRTQITAMSAQLAQAGKPMTEAQTKAITAAMIAAQQRQAQEQQFMRQLPSGNTADPAYRAQMIEESLKRTEESNRRSLEAAAPYIDASQLAVLREQMERRTSLTRMTLRP